MNHKNIYGLVFINGNILIDWSESYRQYNNLGVLLYLSGVELRL